MYSTRPKRGPIEAGIAIPVTGSIHRIPRVLSVAPLKPGTFRNPSDRLLWYSTRPKRGPIEALN